MSKQKQNRQTPPLEMPPKHNGHQSIFSRFATQTARLSGTPPVFTVAVAIIMIWGLTGPIFQFSDTWQLVINTGTTIVTFLMVFLIQNTQNRDSEALHLKLDELIRVTKGAHNELIDLEDLDLKDLDEFKKRFATLAREGRAASPEELVESASEILGEIAGQSKADDNHGEDKPAQKKKPKKKPARN